MKTTFPWLSVAQIKTEKDLDFSMNPVKVNEIQ